MEQRIYKSEPLKTVYDSGMLQTINMFESITRARVKDSFMMKDALAFIVFEGDIYKALGKSLVNLHKIEDMLKRKIKIIEFNADPIKFVANLIYPFKVESITLNEKVITINDSNQKTKGLIIGAKAQNLRLYESIMKKYFEIEEIKVV